MNLGPRRGGSWLVGCGVVLAVLLVLAVVATIFVVRSYRGWIGGGIESATSAALVKMRVEEGERLQIKDHVRRLVTRYEGKEISFQQLGSVFEMLVESPLMGAALVGGVDKLYFVGSTLSDEEKATARNELHRYAAGLFDESIDPDTIEGALASVSTNTPDENDITLQYQTGPGGSTSYALRSADQVSDDDLRELVAQAKARADEAGVEPDPAPIDLSDTLGIAIAQALGEEPDAWVPGASMMLAGRAGDDGAGAQGEPATNNKP